MSVKVYLFLALVAELAILLSRIKSFFVILVEGIMGNIQIELF